MSDQRIEYVAELQHSREVSVLGTADLGFWTDLLSKEGLVAAQIDGQAQIKILAADAKWGALRFREVSFSVRIEPPAETTGQEGAYLLGAFNSSRLFAFCERTFFSSPYSSGRVVVSESLPASIEIVNKDDVVFRVAMHPGSSELNRESSDCGNVKWTGPVFLPNQRRGGIDPRKYFLARIAGAMRTYSFVPSEDTLTIHPSAGGAFLKLLIDSGFQAKEWAIRTDALHGKSKTFRRTRLTPIIAASVAEAS